MNKYLFTFLASCFAYLFSFAQDTSPCNADFTYTVDGYSVKFSALPASTNLQRHSWQFGDGSGAEGLTQPEHTYGGPGAYRVLHVIKDTLKNCWDSVSKLITLTGTDCSLQPNYDWKQDASNCFQINFINKSIPISPNVRFYWKFGDGGGSDEVNPTHTYSQPGEYDVCLVIDAGNNCRKEYCEKIKVVCENPCPVEPYFEWKQDESHPGTIYFYNKTITTRNAIYYKWSFGDGTGSGETDPVHKYEKPGVYKVCLVAELGDGCSKEYCAEVEVRFDHCTIEPKFEWKRDENKWNKIHFANLSQPVADIWKTAWSYGDGTASNDFNSFHTYEKPGLYRVCLKVQSLSGCISEYCDSVAVKDPTSGCGGESDFKYSKSIYNDLEYKFEPEHEFPNRKYYWSFGDGTGSNDISPVYKFPGPGTYKVCLTVLIYNSVGTESCRSTTCKEIRVGADCGAVELKYEYKHINGQPNRISFNAISSQPIKKQKWIISLDTANGTPNPWYVILEEINPTYTFREKGWYLVCLKAIMENGCEKNYCDRIYVEKTERAILSNTTAVIAYPNPAKNKISFELKLEFAQTVRISVLDNIGATKMVWQFAGLAGNNIITLPVEKLSKGMYYALIRFGNQVRWAKFQKG